MTILLNANIYSDTVFNISTGFCRRAYQKRGAAVAGSAPNSKSMFNRKHYGWSESHQTLSVLT